MADSIRLEILSLLEQDADFTVPELARTVGESEETIIEILDQLKVEKILIKKQALIDWKKAGIERVTALIDVKVTPQQGYGFDAIAKRIYLYKEVQNVYLMSGAYDLSVQLEVDSLEAVGRFVTEKLAPLEFVVGTTTHFVMKKYKQDGVRLEETPPDRRIQVIP